MIVKIILIVLVVGGFTALYFLSKPNYPSQTTETLPSATSSETAAPSQNSGNVTTPSATSKTTTQTGTTLTRNQAYNYYSSQSLYSQLVDCVGYPGVLYMRQGTKFMLENTSQIKDELTIKTQNIMIPAKNFAIVTALDSGYYDIVCNGRNALKLQIQPK